MRRLLLALTVLALIVPATAQMRGGGMRAGGGFRAGGFHGVGGFRGPVAARTGTVRFSGRGPIIRTVPPGRFFFPGRARAHGFRHNRFFNCFNGFCPGFNRFNCFNGFCNGFGFNTGFGFNGFGFGGWGLPWYIGDYDSGFTGAAYAEHALRYQDDSRDRQLDELMYELRDQQRELDYLINSMQRGQSEQEAPPQQQEQPQAAPRNNQRPPSRPYSANAAPTPERQQPPTTLVFKDGHRMDVQNYVITKNTLTVIDGGKRQHIPLTELDLAATQKVNEDKGVSFKAPTVSVSLMCNPADPSLSCKPHQAGTEAQRSLTP